MLNFINKINHKLNDTLNVNIKEQKSFKKYFYVH